MSKTNDYLDINQSFWDARVEDHLDSEFYDVQSFIEGRNSLNSIELQFLSKIRGKKILHLQCHFGQDSISLARMGAEVTAVDFSPKAIEAGKRLNERCGTDVNFIECDIYKLPQVLKERYDIVFTSYGTIGWLPKIQRWANVVAQFLKPGGQFVMAEFHPFIWTFDDDLEEITYSYFNGPAISAVEQGSYADHSAPTESKYMGWNHGLSEVMNALKSEGIDIVNFEEYDWSPYDVFPAMVEGPKGEFRIEKWKGLVPLVYALEGEKSRV